MADEKLFSDDHLDRMVAKARKEQLGFAFGFGGKSTHLLIHPSKEGKALFGMLKGETDIKKGGWGRLSTADRTLTLDFEKAISGAGTKAKAFIKEKKLPLGSVTILEGGKAVREEPEAGDAPGAVPPPAPPAGGGPAKPTDLVPALKALAKQVEGLIRSQPERRVALLECMVAAKAAAVAGDGEAFAEALKRVSAADTGSSVETEYVNSQSEGGSRPPQKGGEDAVVKLFDPEEENADPDAGKSSEQKAIGEFAARLMNLGFSSEEAHSRATKVMDPATPPATRKIRDDWVAAALNMIGDLEAAGVHASIQEDLKKKVRDGTLKTAEEMQAAANHEILRQELGEEKAAKAAKHKGRSEDITRSLLKFMGDLQGMGIPKSDPEADKGLDWIAEEGVTDPKKLKELTQKLANEAFDRMGYEPRRPGETLEDRLKRIAAEMEKETAQIQKEHAERNKRLDEYFAKQAAEKAAKGPQEPKWKQMYRERLAREAAEKAAKAKGGAGGGGVGEAKTRPSDYIQTGGDGSGDEAGLAQGGGVNDAKGTPGLKGSGQGVEGDAGKGKTTEGMRKGGEGKGGLGKGKGRGDLTGNSEGGGGKGQGGGTGDNTGAGGITGDEEGNQGNPEGSGSGGKPKVTGAGSPPLKHGGRRVTSTSVIKGENSNTEELLVEYSDGSYEAKQFTISTTGFPGGKPPPVIDSVERKGKDGIVRLTSYQGGSFKVEHLNDQGKVARTEFHLLTGTQKSGNAQVDVSGKGMRVESQAGNQPETPN